MNCKYDLDQDKLDAALCVDRLYKHSGRAPKQFDVADELVWSQARASNALRALQRQGVLAHGYMIAPPRAAMCDEGGAA